MEVLYHILLLSGMLNYFILTAFCQRHWQHSVHKTQEEEKQNIKYNTGN